MRAMFLLALAILPGCGVKKAASPPGFPRSVAVLPMHNETAVMTAPELLRKRAEIELDSWGWVVHSREMTDEELRDCGVTLAGQLRAVTCAELREALDVDAVLIGRVDESSNAIVRAKVAAEVALVDLRDGTVLWYAKDALLEQIEGLSDGCNQLETLVGCLVSCGANAIDTIADPGMRGEWKALGKRLFWSVPLPGGMASFRRLPPKGVDGQVAARPPADLTFGPKDILVPTK